LAGKTLQFELDVVAVRESEKENWSMVMLMVKAVITLKKGSETYLSQHPTWFNNKKGL